MRRLFGLALLSFFSIARAVQPAYGISGADNRVWVNGAKPPWQAIGRIHKAGLGHCTGVLISPGQVLTVAHCIWNKRTGKPVPGEYLFFVAGYHKEAYLAASNISGMHYDPAFRLTEKVDLKTVQRDWALLDLKKPILHVPPMPLRRLNAQQLARLSRDRFVLQAGFSRDRPYILTLDEHCLIKGKARDWNLMVHDCDAIKGDSGSPLMIRDGDGLAVIAIHSATQETEGGETRGLAVPGGTIPIIKGIAQP